MRAAFAALKEFDVVVLTDGDGTYPAEAATLLVGPLVIDAADMAVGMRTAGAGYWRHEPDPWGWESVDSSGFPDLDRPWHHGFAFRLSGVQPAI